MSDERGGRPRPTIVPAPPRRDRTAKPAGADSPQSEARTVARPTAIAGVERRRLPVTAEDLRKLSPQAPRSVVDRALALLSAFVLEKATERKAILWGQDVQKRHSEAVGKALALSGSAAIAKAQGYVARMLELLREFAPDSKGEGGTIFGFLSRLGGRTDTLARLASSRGELMRLADLMAKSLEELLELRDAMKTVVREHDAVAVEAEATALAALFLSQQLSAQPGLAGRFLERSMSLTQTLAQITANASLREIQTEHPVRLITAIQNVTLVSMPDLLASLAAAESLAARSGSASPTEISELGYKIRELVHQLKT